MRRRSRPDHGLPDRPDHGLPDQPDSESPSQPGPETPDPAANLPILATPADGFGPVITERLALDTLADALAGDSEPVALDAERASGFRYHSWAYLIQLKTASTGIALIDPVAFTANPPADLSRLGRALAEREWVLHAASQDLLCLAEVGLRPTRLFDTELAARLAGRPRVGLGPLVEDILGLRLLKQHSSADWSTRPLPDSWLDYAALDVELLVELRDRLDAELTAAGKREWASQEFQHWIDWAAAPPPPPEEPWRRTAGIHEVRSARGLALVRELWQARDKTARQLDLAPGRVLKDAGLTELARHATDSSMNVKPSDLDRSAWFARRPAPRFRAVWAAALERATALPPADWPLPRLPYDGPPPTRSWRSFDPAAAARWAAVRPAVNDLAERLCLPPENLLSPDALRRLAWAPSGLDAEAVNRQLENSGARPWQRGLVTPVLVQALAAVHRQG
ncbi:MAG: HRDC domain-containing protein [Propionibacteriaceae bacterium]|jgi:ribonuclease D|nr:HRDC domain-containing protein [Propionibacteriaceae bacterium]